ncbi:hypothetical protein QFZ81_005581 [Paenibacillus sp. V4I9]|nr:hypothetical protein [Paenibacillus sp. V4I9]
MLFDLTVNHDVNGISFMFIPQLECPGDFREGNDVSNHFLGVN